MATNNEEPIKKTITRWETRENLLRQASELVDYYTELKKMLDDCDINEMPEEIVISANSALDWLLELVDYYTELKKMLDDCDINEMPEEIVISANSALDWLLEVVFFNPPWGLEELHGYLHPEYWDDVDLDEMEDDEIDE